MLGDTGAAGDPVDSEARSPGGAAAPPIDGSPRTRRAVLALAILPLAYLTWHSLYYSPYIVDDAFISLRYALRWADGVGIVYNLGERVEGYSNFLWVAIEAVCFRLGLPVISCIKIIGLLSAVATAALTFSLTRRVVQGEPARSGAALFALSLFCVNAGVAVWAQSGLETCLFGLLVIAMCLRYEVERGRAQAWPVSALLFGLAWMTRPEAPVYGLYFVVRRLTGRERRPLGRGDLNWLLAAACLVAPYEIFGLWYYGALLPNTYGAKLGGAVALGDKLRALAEQPLLVAFVAKQGFGFACLLALGLAGALLRGRKLAPVLWAPLFGASFFVLYAQSDWMPRYRLWIPALPFLCALVASGIVTIARRTGRSRFRRLVVWSACGVFLVQFALHESFDAYALGGPRTLGSQGKSIAWWSQVPAQLSQRTYPMEPLARSLLRLVPEGQTISAVSIGFIGFLTMNPIYDLGGLLTPLAARARFDDSPEVWDAFVAELLSTRPAHIYLVLRHGGLPFELEARLKDHPVIRRSYRRGFYDKPAGGSVAYLRRDLPPVDLEQRLADVLRYFPEYRERAMEMLRR